MQNEGNLLCYGADFTQLGANFFEKSSDDGRNSLIIRHDSTYLID